MIDYHQKRRIALRYRLYGMGYTDAVYALDFAEKIHSGTRKDGTTPEFAHQVGIANYLLTLPKLLYPEDTITVAFLHDVMEDYPEQISEIKNQFQPTIYDAAWAMTKVRYAKRVDPTIIFTNLAFNPMASIAKCADRINNQSSMIGVFSKDKMEEYIDETYTYFFPMIKAARRRFPAQELAYENAKLVLESQVNIIKGLL